MANPNAIPKSLHTVTVLVAMARIIRAQRPQYTVQDAVYQALHQLDYAPEKDCYGLAEQAIKRLSKI